MHKPLQYTCVVYRKTRPVASRLNHSHAFRFDGMRFIRTVHHPLSRHFILVILVSQAAHFEMMRALRGADLLLEADDRRAIFAQRAIHRGAAVGAFRSAFEQYLSDIRMRPKIAGGQNLKLRMTLAQLVSCRTDALNEYSIEQKIRQHDQPPITESGGGAKSVRDFRLGPPRIADKRSDEAQTYFKHTREL